MLFFAEIDSKQGGDDPVVDKEVNIKFFKEIPPVDKRIHIYAGARHEPWNDIRRFHF